MIARIILRSEQIFESACLGAGYTISMITQSIYYLRYAAKRTREITNQIFVTTLGCMPLIFITALFSGMIIALQTGIELQRYGQEAALGYIVPVVICRGMGPVFAAIAVIALIGSTIAAELGTMKVSEEIDALEVMSINPIYFLVMPRILVLAICTPILTIYTDAIGSLGGAAVAMAKYGVGLELYFKNAEDVLKLKDIYGGLLKSFIFGITIASIACSQGLRAQHGAEGVGSATLKTVVTAFVYILIFEYILTWMIY